MNTVHTLSRFVVARHLATIAQGKADSILFEFRASIINKN